jgi:hypothetical protein
MRRRRRSGRGAPVAGGALARPAAAKKESGVRWGFGSGLGLSFYRWRGEGRGVAKAVGEGSVAGAIDGGGARVGAALSGGEGVRRWRRCIEDAWWWEGKRRGRLGGGEGAGEMWVRCGHGGDGGGAR